MLEVEDGGPEISGTLSYNEGLFSGETMSRMADHLLVLLSSILAQPTLPISRLTFIQASERELVSIKLMPHLHSSPREQTMRSFCLISWAFFALLCTPHAVPSPWLLGLPICLACPSNISSSPKPQSASC